MPSGPDNPPSPWSDSPAITVAIPTRGRPNHIRACLGALRDQHAPSDPPFEVVIVTDGPDPETDRVCNEYVPGAGMTVRLIRAEHRGNAHAKNIALDAARAPLFVMLNDDVRPAPGFLAAHRRAHAERSTPAMVLGWSPWVVHEPDRLFDRLIRETSMIFFYDRMVTGTGAALEGPHHDWGFRHAWTLNLSVPTVAARDVSGFNAGLANCCFEDVEFGRRFALAHRAPVLFRPEALAPHDHRYEPAAYLAREFRLGYSAWALAHLAPECAREVFRRDLTAGEELGSARALIEVADPDVAAADHAWFHSLAHHPAAGIGAEGSPEAAATLAALYQRHVPLKRREFASGLLAAANAETFEGLHALDAGPLTGTPSRSAR